MERLDKIYRAMAGLGDELSSDAAAQKFLQTSAAAAHEGERLEGVRTRVYVNDDWIAAIEKGLPFIRKAIGEERQFIRQEGEVVPVEKVRQTSRSSVEHLARHSELITHAPEDPAGDVLPDRLYVTEKLTNYAVYENRFLYMLLGVVRDFVSIRQRKILDYHNTYRGELILDRRFNLGRRSVEFSVNFTEISPADETPGRTEDDSAIRAVLERLSVIGNTVDALFATPLMHEMADTPALRPPIVRTNALRMDNNLRECVALYDYLSAYAEDGLTIREEKNTFAPPVGEPGDEISELALLTSFVTYSWGNARRDDLRAEFEAENARREEAKREALAERIRELRGRIAEAGVSPEEYMLLVEERNDSLEGALLQLGQIRIEKEKLEEDLKARQNELREVTERAELLERVCEERQEKIEKSRGEHLEALRKVREEHSEELTELTRTHAEEMDGLRQSEEEKRRELTEGYEATLAAERQAAAGEKAAAEEEIRRLTDECLTADARFHAAAAQYGAEPAEDFTTREGFHALAAEKKAFDRLYREEWKKTKQRIRREIFGRTAETEAAAEAEATAEAEEIAETEKIAEASENAPLTEDPVEEETPKN